MRPAKDNFSSRLGLGPSASSHRAIPLVVLMASDLFPELYQCLPCVWGTQKSAQYFQHGLTSAEQTEIIPLLSQLTVLLAKGVVGHLCCQGALLAHTHTHSVKRFTHPFSQASTSDMPQPASLLLHMARVLPLTLFSFTRLLSALCLVVVCPPGWQSFIYALSTGSPVMLS